MLNYIMQKLNKPILEQYNECAHFKFNKTRYVAFIYVRKGFAIGIENKLRNKLSNEKSKNRNL